MAVNPTVGTQTQRVSSPPPPPPGIGYLLMGNSYKQYHNKQVQLYFINVRIVVAGLQGT